MRDFFGTPWAQVDAVIVERFLADAGDEGLTWEAKGNREPHRDAVRKAACGFANAAGGFFIVGAERNADRWVLPGVEFRSDEPGTWLSSVIAEGVHPVPPFDVMVFERSDGRHAAVVAVNPLAVPPCVTANGVVFQRVSGQTLPVTDQRVLADLMARGRSARDKAEALAMRAAVRALEEPALLTAAESQLSVALAPVQGAEDKAGVLFSQHFSECLREMVTNRLAADPMLAYQAIVKVQQDCLRAFPGSRELGRNWTAAAYWDGSVSAVYATPSSELYVQELIGRALQAWRVLAEVARELGGQGDTHLVVCVRREHPSMTGRDVVPVMPAQRWTEVREPSEDELRSLQRELQRGFGERAWEDA